MIDNCFTNIRSQHQYFNALYDIAIPELTSNKRIKGYPRVSKNTSEYLFHKAIQWDDAHSFEMRGRDGLRVMSGGLWMDMGFGSNNCLDDWIVDISECKIIDKIDEKCPKETRF